MRHAFAVLGAAVLLASGVSGQEKKKYLDPINVDIPHISTDKSVKLDYDIVYVRAKRAGDKVHKRFYTDFSTPVTLESGADLMLLHPDGKEELLVAGGTGSITDPMVSFDGEWVYYVHIRNLIKHSQWSPPKEGADIFKIHVPTRRIVRLTNQRYSPNTGAANWSKDYRTPEPGKSHIETGVFNMGPCPLPGGRIVFTSNRDGFRPSRGYPAVCLQLFVMDDRDNNIGDDETPANLDKIGPMNLAGALHPVVLADGRIMYSTLESQGIRSDILWGIWTINPDGTNWNPLVSAFDPGGAPNGFHFQTQMADGWIVFEMYYNQNNSGFGTFMKVPPALSGKSHDFYVTRVYTGDVIRRHDGDDFFMGATGNFPFGPPPGFGMYYHRGDPSYASFGPAYMNDPMNSPWRMGRDDNGNPRMYRMPFMPFRSESLTPFSMGLEGPADRSVRGDKKSPAVGKVTHPSAAPDNHLLTVYSPGPVNHQYTYLPQLDGGIYLIKNGEVVEEPSQMLLIKNDPEFNESWPRALVPYSRLNNGNAWGNFKVPEGSLNSPHKEADARKNQSGIKEPRLLPALKNDGSISKLLPAGTPYGLVGTSSFYKRESYPNGVVNGVTATSSNSKNRWKGLDAFTSHGNGPPLNWHNQGADAGLYSSDEIHAVRIVTLEPTTDRRGANAGRGFHNHARERIRILGEIPLRTFNDKGEQPLDPDRNPDTSFLAKIPADTPFTFQTLDRRGMVLNIAQTWHQVRPGEKRVDCGGCHAHSQQPTDFKLTRAGKSEDLVWDLTKSTPLVVAKGHDESKKKWDAADETGLSFSKAGPHNVEYFRDIQPILRRSCVACHTSKDDKAPAGNLDLDADHEMVPRENEGKFPGAYYRLAADERAKFGYKPVGWDSWGYPNASRYVRMFQSRRSLLVWKIFGERLDGFANDDHPSEAMPGSGVLVWKGKEVDTKSMKSHADLDYLPPMMPPPDAVKAGKVAPLSDEDKRTIVRWIDLGCPLDRDYDAKQPDRVGYGWMLDEQRPTLAVSIPAPGANVDLTRIRVGFADLGSGTRPAHIKPGSGLGLRKGRPC